MSESSAELVPRSSRGRSQMVLKYGRTTTSMVSDPRCFTCSHPHRAWVEVQLLRGMPRPWIIKHLEEIEGYNQPTTESLSNHWKNHSSGQVALSVALQNKRAEQIGRDLADESEHLVDGYVMAQMIVQKTFDSLVKGEIDLTASDGMQAAKFVDAVDRAAAGDVDQSLWVDSMSHLIELAREYMDEAAFERFGRATVNDPLLLALAKRIDAKKQQALEEST